MSLPAEFSIRTAISEDMPALIDLINESFAIETFVDGTRTDEERLRSTLQKGDVLIADREGRPAACFM